MKLEPVEGRPAQLRIPIVGLACIAGDRLPLEEALAALPGVADAYVNAADEAVHLSVNAAAFRVEDALAAIRAFGGRGLAPRAPALHEDR